MSEAVQLLVAGGIMAGLSGAITLAGNWLMKRQQWTRDDRVADRAEKVVRKAEEAAELLRENNERVKREAELSSKERLANGQMLKKVIKNTDGALTAALSAVIFEGEDSLVQMEERAKSAPSEELSRRIENKRKHLDSLKRDFKAREDSMKQEEAAGITRVIVEGEVVKHDEDAPAAGDENRT